MTGALGLFFALLLATPRTISAQARLGPMTADSSLVAYDDDGLRLHSADHKRQLKIRGYVTADTRFVLSDTNDAAPSGFVIRRSRVFFDANLNPWLAFRLMYDVGIPSGPSPLQDAFIDVGLGGEWWLRAGKQKTPGGLERYTSISAQLLPERSVSSNLLASRDEGLLLTGGVGQGTLEWSFGVFNGAPDGGTTQDADVNDAKDYTYRLWWRPVHKKVGGVDQGIGIAAYGATGIETGSTAAGSQLALFKTPAQLGWFSYQDAAGVRAAGRRTRAGAFAYVHEGPWGTTAEFNHNTQVVAKGTTVATVPLTSWLISTQYTVTGEPSGADGIPPSPAFDPSLQHWGALQVGMRIAAVSIGDEAFPVFADPATAARRATEIGVGANWYNTRSTKVQLAYEQTTFTGGAKTGDRRAERYVQARWQVYF
ncbi:MAG: porin [Gemmatimonadetes bacterium]|nr:porin [Gemmatimonadota bacterium]